MASVPQKDRLIKNMFVSINSKSRANSHSEIDQMFRWRENDCWSKNPRLLVPKCCDHILQQDIEAEHRDFQKIFVGPFCFPCKTSRIWGFDFKQNHT